MGLDHGLVRRPKNNDRDIVTWRKEWWLREWFAEHLHNFQDNGETYIRRDDLESLVSEIETVLDEPSRAVEFFPMWEGKYGLDFFTMLVNLKADIQRAIDDTNWNEENVFYWEWY